MRSSWEGKRVLVTGAAGFIGSHLADRLVEQGAEVVAFVRYDARGDLGALAWGSNLNEIEVYRGDLRDVEALERAGSGCDAILHLGAHIGVPYSYLAPRDVVETNVLGTLNVLQTARRVGAARIVCASTSEVYGTPEHLPIVEGHPLKAQSPYAASKVGADMLALSFYASYGLPVGLVRPFNTFGPRQSARAVIPTILSQALSGTAVKLGSTHPVRDFTFVKDTVAGILSFAAHHSASGKVVHLGSGRGVSVDDLVALTGEIVGRQLEVVLDPLRVRSQSSEVPALVCDPSVAMHLLGWRAQTPLREGLEQTAAWIERRLGSYQTDVYAV
jgi:dTDP-glucose 4,6-dehydratase